MKRIAIALGAVALIAVAAPFVALRGSLPELDGRLELAGLDAPVTIERDALGIPTISGEGRADVAFATGFVHAQDRFFQMDLARRAAAGRLAELVGDAALPVDRRNRLHRFEAVAARVLAAATDEQRALLDAYAAGVNAGLEGLRVRPFEYLLLRARPQPWQSRDTVLVIHAMFLQLNDSRAEADLRRGVMRERLPAELFDFVNSASPAWEAPIDGQVAPAAPTPGPEVADLRRAGTIVSTVRHEPALPGSNNWALAGRRTANGAGLVANDMHLPLGVPNSWYRARLRVRGVQPRDLAGLTLPGAPLLVAGSNGRLAWGFTNSYGDYSDLVRVELSADGSRYRSASGFSPLVRHREVLHSKSGASEILEVASTEWGPLLELPTGAGTLALRWTAHDPEATNLRWIGLDTAGEVEAALALANTIGGPVQNFVCADAQGSIGWTLLGRLPERGTGYDPTVPSDWTQPDAGWRGFLAPERYPRVVNPPDGQIWTANNRVVGGEALALIGDGSPDRGARARQIRDGLAGLGRATPRDMLAIQLDDRALFLDRWRRVMLAELDAEALAGRGDRAELRRLVASDAARASVDSRGYAYLRRFHELVEERVFRALTEAARAGRSPVELLVPRQFEEAAWRLVSERPLHLLDPRYASWRELLLTAIDDAAAEVGRDCGAVGPPACSWGERNAAHIRHPLSAALPWLAHWLDMPVEPLAGDNDMPRVQVSGFGASERFAVAPGHEREGILHMPGGQSGHPLSPFYRAGHEAWVRGEATRFLPGPARHKLTLRPAR
ncbi:MAG TPA: penicillin acylase family protein [Burkholderiales bacterium]|nr:penicillin acylase family protein [Burkholderiales bacterium]